MNKKLFLSIAVLLSSVSIYAQVGINTAEPDASAYLDVKGTKGGVVFPRLTTSQRDQITEPARGLIIFNEDNSQTEQNIGTSTTPVWSGIGSSVSKAPTWFYMPVTPIDVSVPDSTYTVDLHKAYLRQFNGSTIPSDMDVSSTGIPKIYNLNELEFYVLGYDKSVFSNVAINASGILKYQANPINLSDSTHFNVIFKIK